MCRGKVRRGPYTGRMGRSWGDHEEIHLMLDEQVDT